MQHGVCALNELPLWLGSSEVWGCPRLGGMFLFKDQQGFSPADFVRECGGGNAVKRIFPQSCCGFFMLQQ